jgi:hypothetical protein
LPPAPTVPLLEPCLGGEASRAGRFRVGGARTGGSGAASSGVRPKPKLLQGFPAGSPTGPKPWRFAARQIWNLRPASCPGGSSAEASVPRPAGSLAEASVPPGGPWTEILGPPVSQLPGRNPVLPEGTRSRSPRVRRWRRVDRSPAIRRAGPEPEGPVSRLNGFPRARRPPGNRWALHEACRFRIR